MQSEKYPLEGDPRFPSWGGRSPGPPLEHVEGGPPHERVSRTELHYQIFKFDINIQILVWIFGSTYSKGEILKQKWHVNSQLFHC